MKRSGDWWKLYHDDFWDDERVIMLGAAEQRSYLFLLGLQAKYGSLPSDEQALARQCSRFSDWKRVWPKLLQFFPIGPDGRRRNARQSFELEEDESVRKSDAERKARWRSKRVTSGQCPTGQERDVTGDGDGASPTSCARSGLDGTGRDGTGERDVTPAALSSPELPPSRPKRPKPEPARPLDEFLPNFPALDTPAFRAVWPLWLAYRDEKKLDPYRPIGLRAALGKFARWGPERAVAAIEHTMAMGWEGVREDDKLRVNGRGDGTTNGVHRPELQRFDPAVHR